MDDEIWQYHELNDVLMCEAKVFDNPSIWGLERGRISKLNIYRKLEEALDGQKSDENTQYWELVYEFDRGGEIGILDDKIKKQVLALWPVRNEKVNNA